MKYALFLIGIALIFPMTTPPLPIFRNWLDGSMKNDHSYFNEGELASSGIELMAETGSTTTLVNELQPLIGQNEGLATYTGSGLNSGVVTISINIEVNSDFPAVSLATMLAPSPYWFVACVSVNLLDENNEFVSEKTIVRNVYDAGTEDGNTFSFNNAETQPQDSITKITKPPLGDGTSVKESLCTVTFTKQ